MRRTAGRTYPFTDGKILYKRILISARAAKLTAWIGSGHSLYRSAEPMSFILKHGEEPAPRNKGYVFSQLVIFKHIADF